MCLIFGMEGTFLGFVLVCGVWGLQEKLSKAFTKRTVASGKYITKKVTACADAPEGTFQHPAVVNERAIKKPLAWVPYQRFAQQQRWSDFAKAPERASSVVGKVQSHLKAAAPEGSSKIEPAINEGSTDDRAWVEEITREIGLEAIEAPTYGQPSIEVESDAPLQTIPLAIESPSDDLPSTIDDSAVSCMSSETTAPKSKVQRTVRERAAKLRFRREKKSRIARAPIRRGKDVKERAERPQRLVKEQATPEGGVEADGRMVGLEVEEPEAEDLMAGLDFTGQDKEDLEGGEPMDLRPDDSAIDVDEVMIGYDVDVAIEVVGESPDREPPQLAAGKITKAGSIKKKPESDLGKVLDGRISRERAGFPSQQRPKYAVSGPVVASVQPSQQQAAPIPAPATGYTDASLLQGVAQNLISTNSAADLREARLGKRSETRVAPSVSHPRPIQTPPSTSPRGAETGNTSDTTQPTTTPTPSLPSSTASSAPASPPVRDTASTTRGPPKVCGTGEAQDDRKKRQDPGASNDASEPSPEKASKRVQQRRGNIARADVEIIPLNELPGRAPTGESTFTVSQKLPPHPTTFVVKKTFSICSNHMILSCNICFFIVII